MAFQSHVAVIRFGMGLSPHDAVPSHAGDLLDEVAGPDDMARLHPIPPFATAEPSALAFSDANRARHRAIGTAAFAAAEAKVKHLQTEARTAYLNNVLATFGRAIDASIGFRERLVAFWTDHFTVVAGGGNQRHLVSPFIEEAIRPHVGGRFADMLRAVEMHPAMLLYLQQVTSVGPNSPAGQRRGRGLNENLAREMLELHTLGVGGGYTQTDVRELAELLTGLTFAPAEGQYYAANRAEPGAETVLGVTYSDDANVAVIEQVLSDLAAHPATGGHLARKLAMHFVADDPDPSLVAAIASAYQSTGGDLLACYEVMLTHPAAWAQPPQKIRLPFDFVVGGVRALGLKQRDLMALDTNDYRRLLFNPLRVMGQPWQKPSGPDGWPDQSSEWIIPQTMAGRISWAMAVPQKLIDPLPDPRDVVHWALGPDADPEVVFAVNAAVTPRDGIGVIFASAAYNRR